MRQIIWQSEVAFLLDIPDFTGSYQLGIALPAYVEGGLTKREMREPLGDTARLTLTFSTVLEDQASVVETRNSLQNLNTQPVLCPLWVAKRSPGDSHPVSSDWWGVYEPDLPAVIYDTASLPSVVADGTWIVPMMIGMLAEAPDPQSISSEMSIVQFKFVEDDDAHISFASITTQLGPAVAGITPSLFPFLVDWSTRPHGSAARVDIDSERVGEGRSSSRAFFPQPSHRQEGRYYTLGEDEPWSMIRYFLDLGGSSKSLWLPGSVTETQLTNDVLASDTSLAVADVTSRGANSFVMLDDGVNLSPCKISSNGVSTWNLSAPVGQNYDIEPTQIYSLILARLTQTEIVLTFRHDLLASTTLQFQETPWEVGTILGETIGDTQGARPASAYLFTFTIDIPGAPKTYRFTDFERDLTLSGNTYTRAKIESEEVRETLGLDRQSASIKTRTFAGNPLQQMVPFRLEWPLMVEFCEVDAVGSIASNPRFYFYGEVVETRATGPTLTAKCLSMGSFIERQIPRMLVQPTCNFSVFDVGCGLLRANFEYLAQVGAWDAAHSLLTINTITKSAVAVTAIDAHFFAQGLLILGTGVDQQFRWISDNTVQAGVQLDLQLATPLTDTIAALTPVKFYPGCDGKNSTCKIKFANNLRFGGFDFMPPGNPTFTEVRSASSSGSKK